MNRQKMKTKINNTIENYPKNQLESFIVGDITSLDNDYYSSNMNILLVRSQYVVKNIQPRLVLTVVISKISEKKRYTIVTIVIIQLIEILTDQGISY